MKRLFQIWLVVFGGFLLADRGVSWLGFHHLDLRFQSFAATLVVPVIQSLLLWGARARPSGVRDTARALTGNRVVVLFMIIDLGLLAATLFHRGPLLSLDNPASAARIYCAARALGAGLLWCIAGRRWPGSSVERLLLYAAGALAALFGVDWATGLLSAGASVLMPGWPLLVRSLAVYAPLFLASLLLLLHAEQMFRRHRLAVANVVSVAAALAATSVLVLLLASYARPFLVDPWTRVVAVTVFLTHSSFWASALLLLAEVRR